VPQGPNKGSSKEVTDTEDFLLTLWHDELQLRRALESLVADGLATRDEGALRLAT